MIDQQTTELIKSKMDIYEVVSDFVSLKRSGQNFKAKSPFTNEKTPSFFVVPSKQIFKCFSTGKGGDAITFVMEMEGIGYPEALKWMANKYGIEIQEKEYTDANQQEFNERESLYIILNHAKDFFKNNLWEHDEGKSIGLSYFKERGFSEETIRNFDLGYSLDQWDAFMKHALKTGFNEDILEKSGLIIKNEQKTYDRFRGRVIFPIHNVSGRTIAFGARILKTDKNQPKYINSPETEVYHKSHVLYGMFQAKQAIRVQDNCYLVEGYTDVVSMHQAGVHNVVASSGTSLTEEQIKLISRYTENITVLYDGDNAGIKASLRGIDMILEAGLNVRAVVFPDGEDPDSFSRKVGDVEFNKYLKHAAQDFISFKVGLFVKEAGDDPIKKAGTIREIVESISKIPDGIKRSVYLKEASGLLDMDEQVLITEQNKILIQKRKEKKEPAQDANAHLAQELAAAVETKQEIESINPVKLQERESIRLLINYGLNQLEEDYQLHAYLLQELHGIEFETPVYREILEVFRQQLEKGTVPDSQFFIRNGSEAIKSEIVNLVTDRYALSPNWSDKYHIHVPNELELLHDVAYSNILRLKFRIVRKLIKENMQEMKHTLDEGEVERLQMVHQELKKNEMEIAKLLGNVLM